MSWSVQKEPGQGQGSASVLGEGQSQGRLQRCLLVDVVILKIKQGSSGELAQPGHAVPMESCLLQVVPRNPHSSGTQIPGMPPVLFGVSFVPTSLSCLESHTWQEGWNRPTQAEAKG